MEASDPLPTLQEILKDNPGWLDEAVPQPEASRITGTPEKTLETKRVRGGGPPFVKLGKKVLYIRRDLFKWLATSRKASTCDPGHGKAA